MRVANAAGAGRGRLVRWRLREAALGRRQWATVLAC